ncbi:hypothetical protein IT087_00395 [Candidatus Uhrbacteria bacterium]|nr:hypothetical protein [Candidatus Uhrbacteria bacterium]
MGASLLMGTLAGMVAGTILAFLSHVAPRFGAGNFVPDTAQPKLFGKKVSRREAHLAGLFIHILLSGFFGFMFALFVELGWLSDYAYVPMLIWVVVLTLFTGLVVMPLEGHGFFGRKQDSWFVVDALITNVLWGHLFLILLRLWMLR